MTTAPSNNRASLLSGLRTGGVRSTSSTIPHTAAPGGSFNIPRFASSQHQSVFPEEDEEDIVGEMHVQNMYPGKQYGNRHPMTAAVDGPNNRFSQHQQRGMNPNSAPFTPSFANNVMGSSNAQTTAFQMQMMQMEMFRLQALQTQQLQAEILAQAHLQQQADKSRRANLGYAPPASAGPAASSFDMRTGSVNAQMRRARQENQTGAEDQLPMTAALGGRFGSRVPSISTQAARFPAEDSSEVPPTPGGTTVISGGTSLGNPLSNNISTTTNTSKSDSASSWRRADKNNSVLRGNRISPSVKITPPPVEKSDSLQGLSPTAAKVRPQPLRFTPSVPLPAVAIDTSDSNDDDADSISSSKSAESGSASSPTTPHSSSSNEVPLSPREEASKKLYEGLGIGRPRSSASNTTASGGVQVVQATLQHPISVSLGPTHRMVSQATRQPRGPPSGADELGPKNFATRIRRKAIGGLGMLMGARERRELVEVF